MLKIGGPAVITAALFLWYLNKKDERQALTLRDISSECHTTQARMADTSESMLKAIGRLENRASGEQG